MGRPHAGGHRAGWTSFALALLLVGVPVLTASGQDAQLWTHHQGDAQRSGYALIASGPLDVRANVTLLKEGEATNAYRQPFFTTHAGIGTVLSNDDQECFFVVVDPDDPTSVERRPIAGCRAGWAEAYDAQRELLLVCGAETEDTPALTALDVHTLEPRWSLGVSDLMEMGEDADAAAASGLRGDCFEAAITLDGEGLVVLAFGDLPTREFAVFGAAEVSLDDGMVVWRTGLAGTSAFGSTNFCVEVCSREAPDGQFRPSGLALTTTGVVVTGYVPCARCDASRFSSNPVGRTVAQVNGAANQAIEKALQGAVAWLDDDGRLLNMMRADEVAPGTPGGLDSGFRSWGANWPAANGPLAATAMGGTVVLVNPSDPDPIAVHPFMGVETASGFFGVPGPSWWQDTLVVPLSASVTVFNSQSIGQPRWSWTPGLEWETDGALDLYSALITQTGDVLALMADECGANGVTDLRLYRLGADRGQELQWWDLGTLNPELAQQGCDTVGSMTVLPDGRFMVLVDPGQLFVIGSPDPTLVPRIDLSTTTPPVAGALTLEVGAPRAGSPESVRVFWGDGEAADVQAGEAARHTYRTEGPHTLRVMAIYPDGTTATTERTINVGAPVLNPLQRAFAPENQDLTFGVLGIALAFTGGAIGVARTRRKRSRLTGELEAIDEAYRTHRANPPACEAALTERRAHVQAMLREGRLDDGQASILRAHVDELHRELRVSLLDDRFQFLPHGMVLALRDMLADGQISAWEREHVLRALDEDTVLSQQQKRDVRKLVDAWFQRDTQAR